MRTAAEICAANVQAERDFHAKRKAAQEARNRKLYDLKLKRDAAKTEHNLVRAQLRHELALSESQRLALIDNLKDKRAALRAALHDAVVPESERARLDEITKEIEQLRRENANAQFSHAEMLNRLQQEHNDKMLQLDDESRAIRSECDDAIKGYRDELVDIVNANRLEAALIEKEEEVTL